VLLGWKGERKCPEIGVSIGVGVALGVHRMSGIPGGNDGLFPLARGMSDNVANLFF